MLGVAVFTAALGACVPDVVHPDPKPPKVEKPVARHSSPLARSEDGKHLYVANPDLDSVSVIDLGARKLEREILLAAAPPAVDGSGAFTPSVSPRMLTLSADQTRLYVTGERSGALYEVELASGTVKRTVQVGSEPVGVLASPDGSAVYVSVSQDDAIVRVSTQSFTVTGKLAVTRRPWSLAWSRDSLVLEVSHLLGPGVSTITVKGFAAADVVSTPIPDVAPKGDRRIAHGSVRGLYDLAVRPGTDETFVVHMLLGIDTPQPALDFESTAFPALTRLGAATTTYSTDAQNVPGLDGAFGDVVSGPRALAFSADGAFAFVLDTFSEDVLVVNAKTGVESSLLRPLPGGQPEGLVLSVDGGALYIQERATNDVAVVSVSGGTLALDGAPIPLSAAADPMPGVLRLGEHLFSSANSDTTALTQNHWIACAVCHLEGRSDAVTWRFAQGPRDTPTNAGGMLGTGFLFRTADRQRVSDYWRTINIEQGGHFDPNVAAQAQQLTALEQYVNYGLPAPIPPTLDAAKVAEGKTLFERADVGCAGCHPGPRYTDSGAGNPTLDLTQTVLLHDVGTCASGDLAHQDMNAHPRAACQFDTPSLTGLADSAPYFHDGSAATLHDALEQTRGKMGNIASLSAAQEDALVEYLKSL